jgi:hypothetical protein
MPARQPQAVLQPKWRREPRRPQASEQSATPPPCSQISTPHDDGKPAPRREDDIQTPRAGAVTGGGRAAAGRTGQPGARQERARMAARRRSAPCSSPSGCSPRAWTHHSCKHDAEAAGSPEAIRLQTAKTRGPRLTIGGKPAIVFAREASSGSMASSPPTSPHPPPATPVPRGCPSRVAGHPGASSPAGKPPRRNNPPAGEHGVSTIRASRCR